MVDRYFTPEEANAALAEVRPAAERLVAHRRTMVVVASRRAKLVHRIAGNGGEPILAREKFRPGQIPRSQRHG